MSEVEQLRAELKLLQEAMAQMKTRAETSSGNLSLTTAPASTESGKDASKTEEEKTDNEDAEVIELKKAEARRKAQAQKKKTSPIELLKINQACDLRVTDTLKLKSDKPSDVLSYQVEVENYLKSVGVLFAIDDNEIDDANPFLLVESEVRGKVHKFLLDSWPEDVRTRYRKLSNDDPRILWTLLIEDSFKVDPKKIREARKGFEILKYTLGKKPEDFIAKLEDAFKEYEHLIEIQNQSVKQKLSFTDTERISALCDSMEEVAKAEPAFMMYLTDLNEAQKNGRDWKGVKAMFVSRVDIFNGVQKKSNNNRNQNQHMSNAARWSDECKPSQQT